jgi:hypothetical protein
VGDIVYIGSNRLVLDKRPRVIGLPVQAVAKCKDTKGFRLRTPNEMFKSRALVQSYARRLTVTLCFVINSKAGLRFAAIRAL